jgi:chemotaxis-related protein WspB
MLALLFQIGADRLALDVRQVREVVPWVRLQRVASGPGWLAGVFIYRGQAVPVIDLHQLLAGAECPKRLSSRIIMVSHPADPSGRFVGLLAAQVADVRELEPPTPNGPSSVPEFGQALVLGRELIRVVQLDALLPDSCLNKLALASTEPTA